MPLKNKPLKRLNFIAAHKTKAPEDKLRLTFSATDVSSLRDFDAPPDFFDDSDGDQELPYNDFFPSASKKGVAKRRATVPCKESNASPLEFMYSHQSGDRETFEFNPLVFAPGSVPGSVTASAPFSFHSPVTLAEDETLDDMVLDAALALCDIIPPFNLPPFIPFDVSPPETTESTDVTPSVSLGSSLRGDREGLALTPPTSRPPSRPSSQSGSLIGSILFPPYDAIEITGLLYPKIPDTPQASEPKEWSSRSSKKAGCFPVGEKGEKGGIERTRDDSHVKKRTLADDSLIDVNFSGGSRGEGRQRASTVSGSEAAASAVFSSFSAFSMHSMRSVVKYLFFGSKKEERSFDSLAKSGKHVRSSLVAQQLEVERSKERERVIERQTEGVDGQTSRRGSWAASRRSSSSSSASISGLIDGGHIVGQADGEAQVQDAEGERRVWNTFPTVSGSARKQRFLSAEEEMADRKIESEIDNFIVPDELSPIILRQYGVEIGLKEVNGIRQNALISLPALLNRMGSVDTMEEMTENELGLWGDVSGTPLGPLGDVPRDKGCEEEGIERLISSKGGEFKGAEVPRRPVSYSHALISELRTKIATGGSGLQSPSGDDNNSSFSVKKSLFPHNNSAADLPLTDAADAMLSVKKERPGAGLGPTAFFLSGESVSEKSFLNRKVSEVPKEAGLAEFVPYLEVPVPVAVRPVVPIVPLTSEEAEELILYQEAHLAWSALSAGSLTVSRDAATALLLKLAGDPDRVVEPLETLVLLVDKLGADVNAKDDDHMTPLHSLFSKPALGRFILSRGGDVLAKDDNGDSVLSLCAEYGYPWVLPAFMSMHGREAELLADPERAHEYLVLLISLWGFGVRARALIDEGVANLSADEALDIMDACRENFESMKEPVETFELLEMIVLKG